MLLIPRVSVRRIEGQKAGCGPPSFCIRRSRPKGENPLFLELCIPRICPGIFLGLLNLSISLKIANFLLNILKMLKFL